MELTAVSELREVNCRLGAALSKLQIGHCATPEDFSSLRDVLVLGARATQQASRLVSPNPEWLAELSAYRSNLDKLKEVWMKTLARNLMLATVLALSEQFGEQEVMFLLPMVNVDFLMKVVPYYVFQPWGVMVLQGYAFGVGSTPPVAVTVVSALQYVVAGLVVNVVACLVAGYYFFRRAEVKG